MTHVSHPNSEGPAMVDSSTKERFEKKFTVTPGCWLWNDHLNPKGYGRMFTCRVGTMAHRIAYELYIGQIPAGKIVCHSCDNPRCVNPAHLWLGTDKENSDDKIAKGRWACGERKPGQELSYAKLSDGDVYAIRSDSRPLSHIAEQYGLGVTHVKNIKTRKLWAHLPSDGREVTSVDGRVRSSRLSAAAIRMVRIDRRPQPAIAAEFGVSQSVVSKIKLGKGCYSIGAST